MIDVWPPVFHSVTAVRVSPVVHQLKVFNNHFWGGLHSQKPRVGRTAYTRDYGFSADIVVKS